MPFEGGSLSSHHEPFDGEMRAIGFEVSCLPFVEAVRMTTASYFAFMALKKTAIGHIMETLYTYRTLSVRPGTLTSR